MKMRGPVASLLALAGLGLVMPCLSCAYGSAGPEARPSPSPKYDGPRAGCADIPEPRVLMRLDVAFGETAGPLALFGGRAYVRTQERFAVVDLDGANAETLLGSSVTARMESFVVDEGGVFYVDAPERGVDRRHIMRIPLQGGEPSRVDDPSADPETLSHVWLIGSDGPDLLWRGKGDAGDVAGRVSKATGAIRAASLETYRAPTIVFIDGWWWWADAWGIEPGIYRVQGELPVPDLAERVVGPYADRFFVTSDAVISSGRYPISRFTHDGRLREAIVNPHDQLIEPEAAGNVLYADTTGVIVLKPRSSVNRATDVLLRHDFATGEVDILACGVMEGVAPPPAFAADAHHVVWVQRERQSHHSNLVMTEW